MGGVILTKDPKLLLNDNFSGKPEGIYLEIGVRPVIAFGNSTAQKTTVPHEWRNHTVPYKLGVELMVDAARTPDLVIFSKPKAAHAYWGNDLADIVLIQSGRPLPVVPPSFQDGRVGDRVVIAWNNTREAARAVFDSLDLVRDASSVRVITHIRDETERSAAEASNSAVVTALRCHVGQRRSWPGGRQRDERGIACSCGRSSMRSLGHGRIWTQPVQRDDFWRGQP